MGLRNLLEDEGRSELVHKIQGYVSETFTGCLQAGVSPEDEERVPLGFPQATGSSTGGAKRNPPWPNKRNLFLLWPSVTLQHT